ncbi:serine/threonine-protein kinase [Streptomyces endophyticus]|uniref:non-specific serine/threonine protein kinase n=1 Tax=Streptomyces endophyticus TaxID=714166 RepID=A0ABU6FK27_9ACTN|nr:serine/threonine-protein kinase [Streptomyces endophyticus]MEB8344410.1 protein kinase [Streptomyces endophyticus]
MQGEVLAGRYRLGESIGRGGMGRVWRAHDEVLHRAVAVKELTAAQWVAEADRAVLLARTQTEARAAARINHPAVVTVHDVLEHDDRPWIVMELVEGRSLADAVKEDGRVAPAEAARIGLWTLRALRAAHTAGVLHRDVKPGNVLLASNGQVKLTDFGIAQVEGDSTITRTGEIVGSVDYLAPERVRGNEPGPASDLWALGATLYTAVEGLSPFRRTSPIATMQAVVEDEPEPLENVGAIGPVIGALLSKDPAARPDADAAEAMLAEAAEGRRPNAAQAYVPTQVHVPAQPTGFTPPPPTPMSTADTTTVVPPTPTPAAAPAPAPSTAAKSRHWPKMLAAVLAAVLIGGGGALAAMYYVDQRAAESSDVAKDQNKGQNNDQNAGSQDGSDGKDETVPKDGSIPDSWVRRDDVEGFSLMLPPRWERQQEGSQIDYTPDGGQRFVRIAIDKASDWQDSYQHQLDLEKGLRPKLPDYQRVLLQSNTFRDRPGSLWEFTWTAGTQDTTSGPRHAIEQTYRADDGTEYAIYLSVPAADWPGARQQFDAILRGWRPPQR